MNTRIFPDYDAMSQTAAAFVADFVNARPDALLCFAAGSTPLETLACLVKAARAGRIRFDRCEFIGLDEWVGLDRRTEGTCRHTLDAHFFGPLAIPEDRIHFFDGLASDPEGECRRIDAVIAARGRIDLMLLGLGLNGHLGFNEPGVGFDYGSHVTELDPVTRRASAKYFRSKTPVERGITLGIRHIMDAGTVLLIANGRAKADIVNRTFRGPVTNAVPASVLQRHPDCRVYLDEQAASALPR